jgi:small subunit ribosomal protein S16
MKMMGRRHRPFFRLCAVDGRSARDGKVIEYLGHYDPMVPETDARAILDGPRIDYWLSVGAQPSEKARVLIKKYGTDGTHLAAQQAALERIKASKPQAPPPVVVPARPPQAEATESPAESSAPQGETSEPAEAQEAPPSGDSEQKPADEQ